MEEKNFMETKPVFPLLLSMGLPMMISMLINSLYNIIDSMFIASLGTSALTALSLIYPVQNLIIAAGVGIGVGTNAMIAKSLGAKDQDQADLASSNGLTITLICCLIFILMGIFLVKPFVEFFTDDQSTLNYAIRYGQIVLIGSFGNILAIYMEKIFQAEGRMIETMMCLLAGAGLNIALDPILIFGYFGLPALGTAGAALATVIAQIICFLLYPLCAHFRPLKAKIKSADLRLNGKMAYEILQVAFPCGMTTALPSLVSSILNAMLMPYSEIYVAVLGIYYKIQSFFYLPSSGIIQGMRPVISYNYGAKAYQRVNQTVLYALYLIAFILFAGFLILECFPHWILWLFQADGNLLDEGVRAMRIFAVGFVPSSISVVACGCFEALGFGRESLILSLLRQFVLIIGCAVLFAVFLGATGIFLAYPVSEILAGVFAFRILRRTLKKERIISQSMIL